MHFQTRAIHVGSEPDPHTGAVVPPIHMATTFVQPRAGEWGQYDYSRSGSPTRNNVERTLADLEGGTRGLAFASGMAATHCAMMLLRSGEHVVAGSDMYGGSYRLLHRICDRAGITVSLVDPRDPSAFAAAITDRTRLVWTETIGNPRMTIPDIAAIADVAHARGCLFGIDSTFTSPALLRPIELGADIVMHSGTKYLGGHSDCLAGVLVARTEELARELYFVQNATGGVLAPLESFLLARGLKTLSLRMREHSANALAVARFLEGHPKVKRVLYPGLESHPQRELAARQMPNGCGGMISFEVDADAEATKKVCESTKLFGLAVSLGAVESLIEQPATMSHASYDAAARVEHGITDSLIRISVGLEHPDDLVADLDAAIRKCCS